MNCVRIGFYKEKITSFKSIFKSRITAFIEVPVARNICVSSYILVFKDQTITFRLANKFYKEVKVKNLYEVPSNIAQEKEIIRWARDSRNYHGPKNIMHTVVKQILGNGKLEELKGKLLKEFIARKQQ